jgi:hypothetical protein
VADDTDAAARLLAKLRRLATEELDSDERVLLGVCLAPAVLAATRGTEVEGITSTPVGDAALAKLLRSELRQSNLRIVDFPEHES